MRFQSIVIFLAISVMLQSCIMLRSAHEVEVTRLSSEFAFMDSLYKDSIESIWFSYDRLVIEGTTSKMKFDSLVKLNQTLDSLLIASLDSLSESDSSCRVVAKRLETVNEQLADQKRANKALVKQVDELNKKLKDSAEEESFHTKGRKVSFLKQQFDVYVESDVTKIGMDLKGKAGNSLKSIAGLLQERDEKISFVTNGGMYLKNGEPQGLYVENGKKLTDIDSNAEGYGNFYLVPNGVFWMSDSKAFVTETTEFLKLNPKGVRFATQSGPMLIKDGKMHPAFNQGSSNRNIRSGVGITPEGQVVFAISKYPVNFYDFASLFKDKYGCRNALYLDGAISQMYLPELNRMDSGGNFGVMIYGLE